MVNAVAIANRMFQTKENGIIQCTFVLSNISMWAKLLNHSAMKL